MVHCQAENYDTLEVGGQRVGKITKPCYVCKPEYHVFDAAEKEIGRIMHTF